MGHMRRLPPLIRRPASARRIGRSLQGGNHVTVRRSALRDHPALWPSELMQEDADLIKLEVCSASTTRRDARNRRQRIPASC